MSSRPWSQQPRFARLPVTVAPPPPVKWGVKPYCELDNLNLCIGAPHAGKTYLMLHLALCIASGKPFFGIPTQKARLAWLDCDGIVSRPFATAISRMCAGLGIDPKDIEETFFAAPPQAWTIGTEQRIQIPIEDGGGSYVEDKGKVRLTEFIREEGLEHVFIDVLSSIHTKEETNEGMRDVVRHGLGGVVQATGCGITLLAHTRKALQGKTDAVKTLEDGKGGIELIGAPGVGLIIQRTKDPRIGRLNIGKSRSVIVSNYPDLFYRAVISGDEETGPFTFERCNPPEKVRTKMDTVVEWLEMHDVERLDLSLADLVALAAKDGIKVSESTMDRARKQVNGEE